MFCSPFNNRKYIHAPKPSHKYFMQALLQLQVSCIPSSCHGTFFPTKSAVAIVFWGFLIVILWYNGPQDPILIIYQHAVPSA